MRELMRRRAPVTATRAASSSYSGYRVRCVGVHLLVLPVRHARVAGIQHELTEWTVVAAMNIGAAPFPAVLR